MAGKEFDTSPIERFSNRVAYYEQYRPSYPQAILTFLEKAAGFSEQWVVSDIGSGTGLLTESFADHGNRVFAVEPNKEMRLVEQYGTDYKRVNLQNRMADDILRFFGGKEPHRERLSNDQIYDFPSLRGRALSSSYAPLPGNPAYEPFMKGLQELFSTFAEDGRLTFTYETTVYLGKLL
jgi:SAM-dependent methyltransferase